MSAFCPESCPDADACVVGYPCAMTEQLADNVVRPTIWQQNADLAATRDRLTTADLVLDTAVKAAIESIRGGRPGYALFQLARAQERAGRVLGPTDWSTRAAGTR